jgi:hypothetical protein
MEISVRIHIRMTVHGLNDRIYTPYVRYKPYAHRIWTVFQVVQGSIPSNSSPFCCYWSKFLFLAPHLTERFLCLPTL